jgi:hypothetical protein
MVSDGNAKNAHMAGHVLMMRRCTFITQEHGTREAGESDCPSPLQSECATKTRERYHIPTPSLAFNPHSPRKQEGQTTSPAFNPKAQRKREAQITTPQRLPTFGTHQDLVAALLGRVEDVTQHPDLVAVLWTLQVVLLAMKGRESAMMVS